MTKTLNDGVTVTTLGRLMADAKSRGQDVKKDTKGRTYYNLEIKDGILMLDGGVVAAGGRAQKKLINVFDEVRKAGLSTKGDVALVIDEKTNSAWFEPVTEADMKTARAISPQKRKK